MVVCSESDSTKDSTLMRDQLLSLFEEPVSCYAYWRAASSGLGESICKAIGPPIHPSDYSAVRAAGTPDCGSAAMCRHPQDAPRCD